MKPEETDALSAVDFEIMGPKEPTPGLIAVRLSAIVTKIAPVLKTPGYAPAALREVHAALERLIAGIDAYEIAKAERSEAPEQTKKYAFSSPAAPAASPRSIDDELDAIELAVKGGDAPQEQTKKYEVFLDGEDPALIAPPRSSRPGRG